MFESTSRIEESESKNLKVKEKEKEKEENGPKDDFKLPIIQLKPSNSNAMTYSTNRSKFGMIIKVLQEEIDSSKDP